MNHAKTLLKRLSASTTHQDHPHWQWLEAGLIPALALALAMLFQAENPFFLRHGFPWPWLAPVLVSLRYGTLPGIASGGGLLAAWPVLGPPGSFPSTYFLGGFILTMIAGEYGGLWRTRIRRIMELNHYLEGRIEQLARRHHLLRLSHERLEQSLISRPITLRDALAQLTKLLRERKDNAPLPAAQPFLAFLAQICQFEQAAIFEFSAGSLCDKPIAVVGSADDYHIDDPLVTYALKRKLLCHVQNTDLDKRTSSLLLALPLITSTGETRGVLVVRQMPFFAFTEDALQMLAALGIYYVERIVVREVAEPILDLMPDCPADFAYETFKLQRVQRETGITSAIVVLVFKPGGNQQKIFELVRKQQRSQDMVWHLETGSHRIMATLMPLSPLNAVDGYLARIDNLLQSRFALDMDHAGIESFKVDLAQPGGLLLLQDVLRRNRD